MKSEVEKVIEKELKDYPSRTIRISDREYPLFVFLEDEDLNLFEGFVVAKVKDKSELSALRKYRPPVSGYVARFSIIFYKDQLLIEDYRRNKSIRKTLSKINKTFIRKLKKALTDPKEENFNKLFDRSDVIEEFYILYKKSRDYLLANIKGISDDEKREEFVDNFMMQMLTLWYLQERGFFNGDKSYFITKFKEMAQKKLVGGFNSYYDFLNYFFEKISDYSDSQYYEDKIVGRVVVVGPAVFINGEHSAEAISIPDKCFYKEGMTEILINTPPKRVSDDVPLLNLFESRDWTEGNIDEFVLGAIYEKLITYMERKKLGAYYTPEEITSYICKNTIEPYLIDRINEKFGRSFESIDEIIEAGNREMLLYLFEQLREIKILDPAVGSAHFLESAINVLIDIYEKVWEKTKELKINKLEIIASDEKGRIKKINLMEISNEERFKLYVKFFIILSRNIYGVDINPSALKVARARLFLTLAKHFRVGKDKDIFIRFPNVHFNLRPGNSLIGYVELERERQEGQLVLDLFVKEDKAPYRLELIKKHLKPIEDYLVEAGRALGIDGDIAKEVKELDDILSKDKITWRDFEKVLKTKEKLIRILIASLNSSYAKPLNELLSKITELFNNRLDEKFAEEHGIDLEELKSAKSLPGPRKMFHWIFEFPEVFFDENGHKNGFDVIIGNPPYGRLKQIIKDRDEKYFFSALYSSLYKYQVGNLNLYKLFLERSYFLLQDKGYFSMIFPSSFLGENDSKKLRRLFFEKCRVKRILEFPEKSRVFEGNTQAVCIVFYNKRQEQDYEVKIKTNISKKEKYRLDILEFLKVKRSELKKLTGEDYRIPLFSNPKIEWEILQHISKFPLFRGDEGNPSVGDIGEGHLHETFDREFMSDEPGDDLLIKGIHLDRYFVNLDPEGPKPRWIKNKEEFFRRKPTAQHVVNITPKVIGKEVQNMALRLRLNFTILNKPHVLTNTIRYIVINSGQIDSLYLISVLNSSILNWRFKLFSLTNHIKKYEIEELPIPRISLKDQKPFITLAKYMLFLKQYKNYFAKDDRHLQYIVDYFDNLIDCLVYELYLGDVVKIPIKQFVRDKLDDIELPDNLLETLEKEREEILQKIKKVFDSLEKDKKLNENLYLIKLHPWVKAIYTSLER